MVVGGNLVAGRHAVAGNNGSVHDFRWIHEGGYELLGVHSVIVCIVKKPLGLQHMDISHLGKVRIHGGLFKNRPCLIGNDLVRFQVPSGFPDITRYL